MWDDIICRKNLYNEGRNLAPYTIKLSAECFEHFMKVDDDERNTLPSEGNPFLYVHIPKPFSTRPATYRDRRNRPQNPRLIVRNTDYSTPPTHV